MKKPYTETARFKRLAKQYLKEDKEYEPFGPEWEKEMMKWSKQRLIEFLRTILKK